jgi:SAM-dependent methyltransferase
MNAQPDYFSNHSLKLRFPWRLYHGPIVEALERVISLSPGPDVLNLGSGPFFELKALERSDRRFTICDIDPRAVELAKELYGEGLVRADVIQPDAPLPYADASFDLVVSMDVIEHVPDPIPWTREALRVLRPNGVLFLTTPNYGSLSLRVLENTALEAVARLQNFSRKDIHPTKMTPARLRQVLTDAGATLVRVEPIAFGWVLAAYSRRP